MKTLFTGLTLFALLIVAGFMPKISYAASQDECAIWLCLPGGFPDGCSAAHSAMVSRLKDGKSPLPSFGSCAVETSSSGDVDYGTGAWLAESRQCVKWTHGHGDEICTKYVTKPAGYVKGAKCTKDRYGDTSPPGCKSQSYIDVYLDGVKTGETYYW